MNCVILLRKNFWSSRPVKDKVMGTGTTWNEIDYLKCLEVGRKIDHD